MSATIKTPSWEIYTTNSDTGVKTWFYLLREKGKEDQLETSSTRYLLHPLTANNIKASLDKQNIIDYTMQDTSVQNKTD